MILELKLRKVGNSVGVILPKEALAHLKVEEGDSVSRDGGAGWQPAAESAQGRGRAPDGSGAGRDDSRYRNTLARTGQVKEPTG